MLVYSFRANISQNWADCCCSLYGWVLSGTSDSQNVLFEVRICKFL